eukprot:gene979-9886_t
MNSELKRIPFKDSTLETLNLLEDKFENMTISQEEDEFDEEIFLRINSTQKIKESPDCCYFKLGKCRFGNSCHFKHSSNVNNKCNYGPYCRFGHGTLKMIIEAEESNLVELVILSEDQKELYIFYELGGVEDRISFQQFYIYNFTTSTYEKKECFGDIPLARDCFTLNKTEKGNLILFGGFIGGNKKSPNGYKNDIHELDFKTNTWFKRECTGIIPSQRCGHSTNIQKSTMYIFGGYTCKEFGQTEYDNNLYKLNLKTWNWTHITCKGKIPGRYQHISYYDKVTKNLIILGGFDYTDKKSKIYRINLKSSKIEEFNGILNFEIDYHFEKKGNILLCGLINEQNFKKIGKFVLNISTMKITPFQCKTKDHELDCPTKKIDFMISIQDLLIDKFKEISKFMIWTEDDKENIKLECSLCGNSKNNFICSKCKLIMKDTILHEQEGNNWSLSSSNNSSPEFEIGIKKQLNDCLFCSE